MTQPNREHLAHSDFWPVVDLRVRKLWGNSCAKIFFFTGSSIVVMAVLIGILDFFNNNGTSIH